VSTPDVPLARHTANIGGKKGVRCNAVAAGPVLTEVLLRAMPEAEREKMLTEYSVTSVGQAGRHCCVDRFFCFPTLANGSTVRSSLLTRLDQPRLNVWTYTAGLHALVESKLHP
jgi:NAD(P)-dependent dehydrogenase (short-subunit alcohol dehydrogenase family)